MLAARDVWESIQSPALRCQLVELVAAETLGALAEGWGFESGDEAREYVRGPLERRVQAEAGDIAVEFLRRRCAERGI
ncbi:MAG: hypothetical protein WC565_05815 [Parcubacteria group bacterium]|jgi:hypothetical protein